MSRCFRAPGKLVGGHFRPLRASASRPPYQRSLVRKVPKNPGRGSTSLFSNSHSMGEPHGPQIHAGISSVVLGPGPPINEAHACQHLNSPQDGRGDRLRQREDLPQESWVRMRDRVS